jgi:aldehyde dehydrogenase (NAD+)
LSESDATAWSAVPLDMEETRSTWSSIKAFFWRANMVVRANKTPHGLSAGVWTDKGSNIFKIANCAPELFGQTPTTNSIQPSPFGGYKESGFGREGGLHGLLPNISLS